jgi:uncharacterized repeat protein (TIGR03803 family)
VNNGKMFTLRVSTMCFGIALGALVIMSLVGVAPTVRAQNAPAMKVVYNFRQATGYYPTGVIRDTAGNLYVATRNGGTNGYCLRGCGTILRVSPSGGATVLYAFPPGSPNAGPTPNGLTLDAKGILYGVTVGGGHFQVGSVFKLAPSGTEKTIYNFQKSGEGGYLPNSSLTIDSAGNFYGVTYFGGLGYGVIYTVTPSGSETGLYSFMGGTDGAYSFASPISDAAGNLFGTADEGGDLSCSLNPGFGCGTVWKLDTSGNLTVLYSFTGGTDGALPASGLEMDSSGNLYGTAEGGGDLSCDPPAGCGVVFKIDSSGNFTDLYAFAGGANDGQFPDNALILDSNGNLYGMTYSGGDQSCPDSNGEPGCGTVFKVDSSGNETILHIFTGGISDGALPVSAPLISDGKGNLYGTTTNGGTANVGVLFAVRE